MNYIDQIRSQLEHLERQHTCIINKQEDFDNLYATRSLPEHCTFKCDEIHIKIYSDKSYLFNKWDFTACKKITLDGLSFLYFQNKTCLSAKIVLKNCRGIDTGFKYGLYNIISMHKCSICEITTTNATIIDNCNNCNICVDNIRSIQHCANSNITIMDGLTSERVNAEFCLQCYFSVRTWKNIQVYINLINCDNCVKTHEHW